MNHSIYTDRSTHARIVLVTLLITTAILGAAFSARSYSRDPLGESAAVLKAGKSLAVSSAVTTLTR